MNKLWIFTLLISFTAYANNQEILFDHQWNLHSSGQTLQRDLNDLNSETIIANGQTNWGYQWFQKNKKDLVKKDIIIAVLDGGIDAKHPDLVGQVLEGKNFATDHGIPNNNTEDETGHGTHVAGIIAAKNNKLGIAGFGDFIKILPVKIFHPNEGRYKKIPLAKRINEGIKYAIEQNVDIINLSLGWPKVMHTKQLQESIESALAAGIIVVAASGNSTNLAKIYPCVIKDVVCVGSIDPERKMSRFSNMGHTVDVVAPGEMIVSTYPTNLPPLKFSVPGYEKMSGTSQAPPLIAGMFAMLKTTFPSDSLQDLKQKLFASGDRKGKSLYGLPNIQKAIEHSRENVMLNLKHIPHIILDENYQFRLKVPYQTNFSSKVKLKIKSDLLFIEQKEYSLSSHGVIEIKGFYFGDHAKTNLIFHIPETNQRFILELDLLKSITQTANNQLIKSKTKRALLIKNDVRLISKLKLVQSIVTKSGHPLFYYYDEKENFVALYKERAGDLQEFNQVKIQKDCRMLRFYHINLDSDNLDDYLIESYCSKKEEQAYLSYTFLNHQFEATHSNIKFTPEVALINYENVIFKQVNNHMHIFFSAKAKLPQASQNPDPWSEADQSSKVRILHLQEQGSEFISSALNNYQFDQQISLDNYQILNVDFQLDRINIFVGGGEQWDPTYQIWDVDYNGDLISQHDLKLNALILGNYLKKDKGNYIMENFYTPFQGKIKFLNPISQTIQSELSISTPLFNPMFGSLGHFNANDGKGVLIKSYLYIHFLTEQNGKQAEVKIPYERLDFLGKKDLQEKLTFIKDSQNAETLGQLIIDGTNISLETVKVIDFKNHAKYQQRNFHIPKNCAGMGISTNENGMKVLNFLCAKDRALVHMSQLL